jgi:acetoin:2,6-dichlorophenolindophenol oxidoreductase subunit alpha
MADPDRLVALYRLMQRVRTFEEQVAADFRDGHIPGIVHLSIGQEAVPAGVSLNLREDDFVTTTHRGHGHLLAKGAPMNELMAEIWGKKTGLCKGKGGSMHISHLASGGLGANSVVGAGQPFAAGAAMAIRQHGGDQVVVSYFGDGAVTAGGFHEGAVLSATFSLPVLYVGENNGYSETTGARLHLRGGGIADALRGFGFRSLLVDGMDVEAVDKAASELIESIRRDQQPALLECETYRFHGHFEGDPMLYRSAEELERWKRRDPLEQARKRLEQEGVPRDRLRAIDDDVRREVDEAVVFAERSELPDPERLLEGVYA